ncbi:MAG: hypothetical protein GXO22_07410 [Aquificae bacterium]|nr:hypothetical protein [Aquificota bacterium]
MVLKLFIVILVIFFVGLGIDYIFVILEKKGILEVGSFLHILANGVLIFIPLSIIRKKNFYICFPLILFTAFIVYAPIVIIKYSYIIFLSIAVYTIFAFYIICKKSKHIGEV